MGNPTRREFIAAGAAVSAAALAWPLAAVPRPPDIAITRHGPPAQLVRKAIDLLGGISRFVRPGESMLIKPNMSWDRLPEQAANTNPDAVAEVVKMCQEAGAVRIRIVDNTCNQAQRCYKRSGIEEKAVAAGAQVRHIVAGRFVPTDIPFGLALKSWPVYKDVFDCDVLINMPIAKSHNVSGVTLGMKNLMGLLGGNRGELHVDFATKIVDINTVLRPALTIIDAYRILVRNGPSGGSLDDVVEKQTVIAGTDPVAVDANTAALFGLAPADIDYLQQAEARGLGTSDFTKMNIQEFNFP